MADHIQTKKKSYEYGVLMKVTSAKRLNKADIRDAFTCGWWSMEPFPCDIKTEVLEIGPPTVEAALALRVFTKQRGVNERGERSVPTKITDAHWIASGGMGDPTP